jgi:hypothetical protein
MDVTVIQRAFTSIGEELVDRVDPRGVDTVGTLEHPRDLEELVADGGDPVVQQDRASQSGWLGGHRSTKARSEGPAPAASEQSLFPHERMSVLGPT